MQMDDVGDRSIAARRAQHLKQFRHAAAGTVERGDLGAFDGDEVAAVIGKAPHSISACTKTRALRMKLFSSSYAAPDRSATQKPFLIGSVLRP